MPDLKSQLITQALELGFADCRIAEAKPAAHKAIFEQWVADGKYGDMAWMARNLERRTDPRVVLPGARSVVVLALNYFQGSTDFADDAETDSSQRSADGTDDAETDSVKSAKSVDVKSASSADYRIARYAWNEDYHELIEKKLKALDAWLIQQGGTQRYYVDTGPVLERDFASDAGLGWGGKSTMQIHRRLGTWFFLAELITTLDLPADTPAKDLCGKCTRCMDACPTQAITAPQRMDARRCISYLTIESKGSIPEEFRRAMGDRIYGCDDCLTACPWNKFAQVSHEATFQARESVFSKRLRDFLTLTDDEFRVLFAKSPIKRIKRPAFIRNVCVALGNTGSAEDLPALEPLMQDEHPLIAEHAAWAVQEIRLRQEA